MQSLYTLKVLHSLYTLKVLHSLCSQSSAIPLCFQSATFPIYSQSGTFPTLKVVQSLYTLKVLHSLYTLKVLHSLCSQIKVLHSLNISFKVFSKILKVLFFCHPFFFDKLQPIRRCKFSKAFRMQYEHAQGNTKFLLIWQFQQSQLGTVPCRMLTNRG